MKTTGKQCQTVEIFCYGRSHFLCKHFRTKEETNNHEEIWLSQNKYKVTAFRRNYQVDYSLCEQNRLKIKKIFTDQQTRKNFNRHRYQVVEISRRH